MAAPTYLNRLAAANLKVGDKKAAAIFSQEAQRVRDLINKD